MSGKWEFPFEAQAREGAAMPEELSLADRMAFTTLRGIYRQFFAGQICRDQAAAEKRQLKAAWEKARDAEAFDRKLTDRHVRLIRAVERAVCDCRREPTRENALRLCDAIDGMGGAIQT